MTQEFKLPEKWCVKPKNKEEVDKIFQFEGIGKHGDSKNIYYYQHFPATMRDYTAFSKIQEGYKEITFDQFKEHVLKEKLMIDYTIPGTKLPEIPFNTEFRLSYWENSKYNSSTTVSSKIDFISYGSKIFNGETYILADKRNFGGTNYYMFKLTDLNKLTNMEEQEIEGYEAPTDLFNGLVKKGDLYVKITDSYGVKNNPVQRLEIPKEIVETWKPVYKTKEQTVSMNGKFNLTIKDKRVFHKSEDITQFVKDLVEYYEKTQFGKYSVRLGEISFESTGCQCGQITYIGNWKKVYDLIK